MNCNWKAYKVFNNGKRAKAPYLEFEYDESEGVEEYFNTKFKVNFPKKFRRSKFMFLHGDLPQERTAEAAGLAEEAHKQQRNQVLNKQIKSLDAAAKCCVGTVGALVWMIKKGDLVRVRTVGTSHNEDLSVYKKGIVIGDVTYTTENQIKIWPTVKVFIFETESIRYCLSGRIEVLSSS